MRLLAFVVFASLFTLSFAACGSAHQTCIEGSTQLCFCPDGRTGAQACNASGAFDACACAGELADAGLDMSAAQCALSGGSGCNKVDFLFVVDNSISMGPMQDNLATNFAAIFQSIRERLSGVSDYHLMFVDSDSYGYEATLCEGECGSYGVVGQALPSSSMCSGYVCGSVGERGECDTVLGAGAVRPLGGFASNRDCDFPQGRRWLSSDDADLAGRASCAVRVGATGSGDELVLGAAVAAVERSGEAARCNEGFLRDDALLVVVLVSDATSSTHEQGLGPAGFRRRLLDAKCGRQSNVVVIGLLADGSLSPPPGPDGGVDGGSRDGTGDPRPEDGEGAGCWTYLHGTAPTYTAFVDSFGTQGFRAHVCEPDYSDVFSGALDVIAAGCDETVW